MYDWETFQAAYQAATDEKKAIIDSEVISLCIKNLIDSRAVDSSHYRNLIKLYPLFVLGSTDELTLLQEMQNLGIPESKTIFDSLKTCVEETEKTKDQEGINSDIAATEATLSSLPAIPGYQNQAPVAEVPTYSSTQEAILNERNENAPQ